ncbi:MAG: methyltransferase [Firmicutes bacterium]|nr:methyltransferase [Bacillota bacterium]
MSEQYFTAKPQSVPQTTHFEAHLRGHNLRFETDRGVFSRGGVDFGSRLLIEAVVLHPGDRVLDLGCGYGPVGVALAVSEPTIQVTLVDVNERALMCARLNAVHNQVADRLDALCGDGTSALPADRQFAVIALNPPIRAGKATVYRLFAESASRLLPTGQLYVVIQKKQGAESAGRYLGTLFKTVETVAKDGGYRVYRCASPQNES